VIAKQQNRAVTADDATMARNVIDVELLWVVDTRAVLLLSAKFVPQTMEHDIDRGRSDATALTAANANE
jgi:hypothetical protein